jgi:hypothetical protein
MTVRRGSVEKKKARQRRAFFIGAGAANQYLMSRPRWLEK